VRPADKLTQQTAVAILANNEAREAIGCKYEAPQKPSATARVAAK
jgi:hypothetical protein